MTDLFRASDADLDAFGISIGISVGKANRLYAERVLAKGKVVVLKLTSDGHAWDCDSRPIPRNDHTHTALLIQIEEIEKDSPKKLLREVANMDNSAISWHEMKLRAKRLLGGE